MQVNTEILCVLSLYDRPQDKDGVLASCLSFQGFSFGLGVYLLSPSQYNQHGIGCSYVVFVLLSGMLRQRQCHLFFFSVVSKVHCLNESHVHTVKCKRNALYDFNPIIYLLEFLSLEKSVFLSVLRFLIGEVNLSQPTITDYISYGIQNHNTLCTQFPGNY